MPEPWPFLQATGVAATLGLVAALALSWRCRPQGRFATQAIDLLAIGVGFAAGCYVFPIRVHWPPASGLDRFLLLVLPMAAVIELLANAPRVPAWLAWAMRSVLALAAAPLLLYGSVYVAAEQAWPWWQQLGLTGGSAAVLLAEWFALLKLAERDSPEQAACRSILIALALAIAATGIAIMLGGYLRGGAVTFPLAAAMVGTVVGTTFGLRAKQTASPGKETQTLHAGPPRSGRTRLRGAHATAAIGIALVALFALVVIGRFFGRLSSATALALLLSPLLAWASELLPHRLRKPWLIGLVRVVAVSIVLLIVLVLAKQKFDRTFRPLLRNKAGHRPPLAKYHEYLKPPWKHDPFSERSRRESHSLFCCTAGVLGDQRECRVEPRAFKGRFCAG